MQEHFDLLHQAIVSVRTSMSASRSHVTTSSSMDMQSRYALGRQSNIVPGAAITVVADFLLSTCLPSCPSTTPGTQFSSMQYAVNFRMRRPLCLTAISRFAHLFVEKFEKEGAAFFRSGGGGTGSSLHSLSLSQLDDRLQQPGR